MRESASLPEGDMLPHVHVHALTQARTGVADPGYNYGTTVSVRSFPSPPW